MVQASGLPVGGGNQGRPEACTTPAWHRGGRHLRREGTIRVGKEETILDVVREVYGAAEVPARWPRVLDRIADTLRSTMTVLFSQNLDRSGASVVATTRIDPGDVQRYAGYYATRNVYFEAGRHLIAPGAVIDDSMYDAHVLRSSEYYTDYLAPLGAHHTIAVVLAQEPGAAAMLSTFRSASVGPYRAEELEMVRLIQPHLEQAFRIHNRLFGAASRADFSLAALDLIPTGVAVLDERQRVKHLNASAEAILRMKDGVTIEEGAVRLASSGDNRRLAALLNEAQSPQVGNHAQPAVLLAPRPSGRPPYSIVVAPLGPGHESGSVALLITDSATTITTEATVRSLYGLTPAESRVAVALLSGRNLDEIAGAFDVSIATVRTHLQRIFSKTGTRRQSELIRLLTMVTQAYQREEE